MFDYVVVGAGTAGCTLAARLTENPSVQVLLIEAGPAHRRSDIRIPANLPKLLGSALDWRDSTEPQPQLRDRRLAWPRGKVLGGSGSIGAMIHMPGCRADYDSWKCAGWGYDDLHPLFYAPPASATEPAALTRVFLQASSACGIPLYKEFRGPEEPGAGMYPLASRNHARWSAANAFLRPALRRGNLTVWTGIQVTRVAIEAGRAAGVEYLQRGSRFQVNAAKEVILCAGAVGSPQLLLLSGIGPRADLEALGIAVKAELPGAGENLQDHLAVELSYWCREPVSLARSDTPMNLLRFRANRSGPCASNLLEAGAYTKSRPELPACDAEVSFVPLGSLERGLDARSEHGFCLFASLLTPRSRGRVTLASADALEAPRIDPCYAAEPEDAAGLEAAAKLARAIVAATPFDSYRGPSAAGNWRETARSMFHPGGSCKMGEDPAGVVDPSLRVHGVAGLRVADASIMPVIPRAHPLATVMMIGEKAAKLILGAC